MSEHMALENLTVLDLTRVLTRLRNSIMPKGFAM